MQKARRHNLMLRPLVGTWFQGLFHSSVRGAFHLSLTVLVHYRSLRSIQPYRMVPADFSCPALLRSLLGFISDSYTGLSPSVIALSKTFYFKYFLPRRSPTTPILPKQYRFGLFPFRSPLLWESFLFSFPTGTQMFQFPAFAHYIHSVISSSDIGLPHSEIHGSRVICTFPQLIAAYHVLLRL